MKHFRSQGLSLQKNHQSPTNKNHLHKDNMRTIVSNKKWLSLTKFNVNIQKKYKQPRLFKAAVKIQVAQSDEITHSYKK